MRTGTRHLVWAVLLLAGTSLLNAKQKERVLVQGEDPAVSPDGKMLAFRRWVGRNSEIFVAPLDGSSPPRRLTDDPSIDRTPAWSPDGRVICFVSGRSGNKDLWLLELAHPEAPRRLTTSSGPEEDPAWSPDGKLIAYSSLAEGSAELFVVTSLGGEPVRLTRDAYDDTHPTWSPDGLRLAFVSDRGDGQNLWMIDLGPISEKGRAPAAIAGSGAPLHIYELTRGSFEDMDPAWRPGGDVIAFSTNRTSELPGEVRPPSQGLQLRWIYLVSTGPRPILTAVTTRPAIAEAPAWTPDGRGLLFVQLPLPGRARTEDEAAPTIHLLDRGK